MKIIESKIDTQISIYYCFKGTVDVISSDLSFEEWQIGYILVHTGTLQPYFSAVMRRLSSYQYQE